MKKDLKCPKCGGEKVAETGLSHGLGTGPNIPKPIFKQYQCLECGSFYNFPKLSR